MESFETKLESLVKERATKKKSEQISFDDKIINLLVNEFTQAQDIATFFNIIETKLKNLYHIAAKSIPYGFSQLSRDSQKIFEESLSAAYEKALVYQIIVNFLVNEKEEFGIQLFSTCCDRITNDGRKRPAKEVSKKIATAFFQVPGLKEKPMRIILERDDLPKTVILCLATVLLDQRLETKQKQKYPILKEKILIKLAKVWGNMAARKRISFEKCIIPLLKEKQISDLLVTQDKNIQISDDFINKFFPKMSTEILIDEQKTKSNAFTEKEPVSEALVDESIVHEEHSFLDRIKGIEKSVLSVPSENKSLISPHFNPYLAIDDLLSWIKDAPIENTQGLSDWLENQRGRINQLKEKERDQKSEIANLKTEIQGLLKIIENKDGVIRQKDATALEKKASIKALEEKIDLINMEWKQKFQAQASEGESREKRLLKEYKNKVEFRLQPLVNEFRTLNSETDIKTRDYAKDKIFMKIVETLQHILDIRVE